MNLSLEHKSLEIPKIFDFPFPPYDIQHEFMKNLYLALDNKKLGIFESPTGTGKSLSIICGSIKWLKDRRKFERLQLSEKISKLEEEKQILASDTKDWLTSQSKEIELSRELNCLKLWETKILEYDKKIEDIRSLKDTVNNKKWKMIINKKNKKPENPETENIVVEKNNEDDLLPDENYETTEELDEGDKEDNKYEPLKIYICSRTHSQLAQFVGEIVKSPFSENIRVTSLASRQTYCINPNVSSLKNVALINERCLDMQKKDGKTPTVDVDGKVVKKQKHSTCSCPYYKQTVIEDLKNIALVQIQDVEDLVSSGKELNACPYYASRKAAEDAEVVLIPYNTLLHRAAREANGIKLKNNIVIIDEAHNLLEALAQMHNADLGYCQLYHALHQMRSYKNKFNTRLSAKNLLMINQLIFVINKLFQIIEKHTGDTKIFTIQNFVLSAGIDNYNMFKLIKFCKESRMAYKIRSYAMKFAVEESMEKPTKNGVRDFLTSIEVKKVPKDKIVENIGKSIQKTVPSVANPLLALISFLETLTCSYEDGRILLKNNVDKFQSKLQFLLLNPSSHFSDVINEARSVIVAGGTMKPIAEFRDRLFINAGADPERILEFSCDHIVPAENILPIIVTKGKNNENLLFNFENRMSMGNNIKTIILEACKIIQGGIVVFFPSYKYENWVWDQMKGVNFGRAVFREPHTNGAVDSVLEKYADAIKKSNTGALLFSVVGGKLSEGLNFSDDLGRCVIVVGLPYANIMATDLKEKMNYLNKTEGPGSGQKYYENQCMKAVNQCIGRAVRHKNDYATVLLLDERYNRSSVKNALPNWIKKSLKVSDYKGTFDHIKMFFGNKRNLKTCG